MGQGRMDMAVGGGGEALLLREFGHRTLNEVAAAIAALRLVDTARTPNGRRVRVEDAVARLEAFAEVHRLLAAPVPPRADVASLVERVCRGLGAGRTAASRGHITLNLAETWIDGGTARSCALVAAELVTNAIRYALDGRPGSVTVTVRRTGDDVVLVVSDDGPGIGGTRRAGTGLGRGIVAELVGRSGGSMSVTSGPGGTTVSVLVPTWDDDGEETGVDF